MFRPRAAAKHKAFVPYIKESGVLTLSREELHIAVCTTFGSKKVPLYTIVYGLGWGWRSKSDAWRNYRWSCGLYAEPCTAIVLNHDKTLIEHTRCYWDLVGERVLHRVWEGYGLCNSYSLSYERPHDHPRPSTSLSCCLLSDFFVSC